MKLSLCVGWDFPSAWTKHGRLRKAWWLHAWCGIDYAFYGRFTMGFRVLGFEIGIDIDW